MRRNIFLLVICLALLVGLFTVQASAEEPTWLTAYEQILNGRKQEISEGSWEYSTPDLSYLVYDIDKDGIPELVIKTGTCEADYHGWIYAFRDGRAVQIGEELGLGHSSFYSDPGENGIILMYGHMGYASAQRISIGDAYTAETLYEDDLNVRLQEDPGAEYVYPGDVIPGSCYLTLCRADVTLPLTHYEEISACLEGSSAHYPNNDAAFYTSLMINNGEVFAVTADGFTNSPGRIGFHELLRQNTAANWMQGDLQILSAAAADLNGDGQLECILTASEGGSEMRIVLSEQNGVVYAYLMNYTNGYELDSDGCFRTTQYYITRFRLIFDGPQAFLLTLPNT
ncbi:MAG: hypothetical protein II885_15220 [Oscillospiraceae bacterium]|nr:hypothetical protein [Oscillospiraceae bacterium]